MTTPNETKSATLPWSSDVEEVEFARKSAKVRMGKESVAPWYDLKMDLVDDLYPGGIYALWRKHGGYGASIADLLAYEDLVLASPLMIEALSPHDMRYAVDIIAEVGLAAHIDGVSGGCAKAAELTRLMLSNLAAAGIADELSPLWLERLAGPAAYQVMLGLVVSLREYAAAFEAGPGPDGRILPDTLI